MKGRESQASGHPAGCEGQQRISELFHALSQPVTALCCCLAVSRRKARGAELRRDLEVACAQAEQVAKLTAALRELVEEASMGTGAGAPLPGDGSLDGPNLLRRQNFPISSHPHKTGNNLPL